MKRSASRKPKPAGRRATAKPTSKSAKPKSAEPTQAGDTLEALVAANAEALGIVVDPDWRAGIVFNLGLILRFAALIDEFALPDDIEPAPVFHA